MEAVLRLAITTTLIEYEILQNKPSFPRKRESRKIAYWSSQLYETGSHGCPCNFGSDPSQGFCEGIIAFHIQEGNYGNTRLDGLNVVLNIRSPGNMLQGGWTLGTYLDQRATQEQTQALEAILSGQAGGLFAVLGGLIEKQLPTKQVPINWEAVDGEHRLTVPGLLEVGTERISNPMPGQPPMDTKISGPLLALSPDPVVNVRRTSVMKLTDPDLSFDHSGRSALTGKLDLSGP